MPLKRGYSRKTVKTNIHELAHGPHASERTNDQNVAIAFDSARKEAFLRLGYIPSRLKKKSR